MKKGKNFKSIMILVPMLLIAFLVFAGCGGNQPQQTQPTSNPPASKASPAAAGSPSAAVTADASPKATETVDAKGGEKVDDKGDAKDVKASPSPSPSPKTGGSATSFRKSDRDPFVSMVGIAAPDTPTPTATKTNGGGPSTPKPTTAPKGRAKVQVAVSLVGIVKVDGANQAIIKNGKGVTVQVKVGTKLGKGWSVSAINPDTKIVTLVHGKNEYAEIEMADPSKVPVSGGINEEEKKAEIF